MLRLQIPRFTLSLLFKNIDIIFLLPLVCFGCICILSGSEGMADYQHVLAVHADVARRKKRNWDEVEPNFG